MCYRPKHNHWQRLLVLRFGMDCQIVDYVLVGVLLVKMIYWQTVRYKYVGILSTRQAHISEVECSANTTICNILQSVSFLFIWTHETKRSIILELISLVPYDSIQTVILVGRDLLLGLSLHWWKEDKSYQKIWLTCKNDLDLPSESKRLKRNVNEKIFLERLICLNLSV